MSFDGEVVQLDGPRAELHADGGAAVVQELILGEAGQEVALSHTGLPDQNHCTDTCEEVPITPVLLIINHIDLAARFLKSKWIR